METIISTHRTLTISTKLLSHFASLIQERCARWCISAPSFPKGQDGYGFGAKRLERMPSDGFPFIYVITPIPYRIDSNHCSILLLPNIIYNRVSGSTYVTLTVTYLPIRVPLLSCFSHVKSRLRQEATSLIRKLPIFKQGERNKFPSHSCIRRKKFTASHSQYGIHSILPEP